eukprot:CAMPEP_0184660824 /NCGR_PEP_ID=MMETSP0308-20130426/35427_1 /TAXON_ID=38269 /ORGANISM="Gloeochaete witrockiana, Strain SAG 46.84" /LENGTH=443 /DNA_ID=CAMNT_0027101687 /DNA_START=158 /DNA_END=1489 /DNA_ORIENTATION=+
METEAAAVEEVPYLGAHLSDPIRFAADGAHDYEFLDVLGRGGFSVVQLAREKSTGKFYAAKRITRQIVEDNKVSVMREIEVLRRLNHPHVLLLHDIYETREELCILTELIRGGELFDRILQQGSYSEKDAADVIRTILLGLAHVHSRNIAHCDLKPENLMYVTPDADADLKIIDFGLAHFVGDGDTSLAGTPEYIAPEVIRGLGYSQPVDMWSVGVVLYILLCGYYPFYGKHYKDIFKKSCSGVVDFPANPWQNISAQAKDLIQKLLEVDPYTRLTALQTLEHPWVRGASDAVLPDEIMDNLAAFNARRRFRKGIWAAIALGRLSSSLTSSWKSKLANLSMVGADSPATVDPGTPSSTASEPPVATPTADVTNTDASEVTMMTSVENLTIDESGQRESLDAIVAEEPAYSRTASLKKALRDPELKEKQTSLGPINFALGGRGL